MRIGKELQGKDLVPSQELKAVQDSGPKSLSMKIHTQSAYVVQEKDYKLYSIIACG